MQRLDVTTPDKTSTTFFDTDSSGTPYEFTSTWNIGNNQIVTSTVRYDDGVTTDINLNSLSLYERSTYKLYTEEQIGDRLEQLGLGDSYSFKTSGFDSTGDANADLDNYQFSSWGQDYYFMNPLSGFVYSSPWTNWDLGWTGYGDSGNYTCSWTAIDAINYMYSATNWVSPLILDLDGDGVAADLTHAYSERVYFDIDNDGAAERVGWSNGDDGLLAVDTNGNGRIDNITELFGDDQMPAFQKLKAWDSNNDGKVDASDAHFDQLKVWKDTNRDGLTQAGELISLDRAGVLSISVVDVPYLQSPYAKAHGLTSAYAQENYLSSATTFVYQDKTGGTVTREIADVHFMNDNLNTWNLGAQSQVFGASITLNLESLMLPLSRGYGTLASLHLAMSANTTLHQQVAKFATLRADQIGEAAARIDAVLLEWAGVADHDPNARETGQGNYIDARKVDFLEQYTGVTWAQRGTSSMVGEDASIGLKKAWAGIEQMMLNRLLIQGPLQDIFSHARYDFATDTLTLNDSLETLLSRAKSYAAQTGASNGEFWKLMGGILAEHKNQWGVSLAQVDASILNTSGIELHLQEVTLTAADGPLFTGKPGSTETLRLYTFGGSTGNDTIAGSETNDYLFGHAGNDALRGGGGDHLIACGEGFILLLFDAGRIGDVGKAGDSAANDAVIESKRVG